MQLPHGSYYEAYQNYDDIYCRLSKIACIPEIFYGVGISLTFHHQQIFTF